jgi:hypothetical protein
MASTISSVHPPIAEDNNLALRGVEAKLTRNDTTRKVLPNLGYPLHSSRYPQNGTAQPTSTSSVVASGPLRFRESVCSLRFGFDLVDESALTPWKFLYSSIQELLVEELVHLYCLDWMVVAAKEPPRPRRTTFALKLLLEVVLVTG